MMGGSPRLRPGGGDKFIVTTNENYISSKIQLERLINKAKEEFKQGSVVGR